MNLIIGIEPGNPLIPDDEAGSIKNPRRWFRVTKENCDQHLFANFMDQICTDLETDSKRGDEERYFLYDNLAAHLTPLVHATIHARALHLQYNFTGIARPPYQPKFGPIEYIIGQIAQKVSAMHCRDWTEESLEFALRNICRDIGRDGVADRTFAFVGYQP